MKKFLCLFVLLATPAFGQVSNLGANQFLASPSSTSGVLAPRGLTSADLNAGITLGGVLTGTFPNPTLAAGAAATNVGSLGGVLSGTLPSPSIASSINLPGSPTTTTQAATDNSTNIATTAWYNSVQVFKTFQQYGAAGDGSTNDTAAVSSALNSGVPILCNGTFKIESLITITNTNVFVQGGGMGGGCTLLLSSNQSMLYATENAITYNVTLKDVKFSVAAAITAVTGPATTAALYVTYPSGTNGSFNQHVTLENVQITNTTTSNYILNGVALNDVGEVKIEHFWHEGNASTFNPNTTGITITGSHSPAQFFINHLELAFEGTGVLLSGGATGGWQGVRIVDSDCVYCNDAVAATGSSDGTSDQLEITGFEAPAATYGIYMDDVLHVNIHNNYIFLANPPISGNTPAANPTCYQYTWDVAIPANGTSAAMGSNHCDGYQLTSGYTNRYGLGVAGVSNTIMNVVVLPNMLANLDYGMATFANTNGVTLYKQSLKNVTSEWINASTAGDILPVPPLARSDGSVASCGSGLVGEVCTSTIASGSAVSLSTGVAKNLTSLTLGAGHWSCYGMTAFLPGASTTISLFAAGISGTTNTLPSVPQFFLATTYSTGVGASVPVNTVTLNPTSSTPYYMVAESNFAVSTMGTYGTFECQRTE
jgi:hypothetical protein